MTFMMLERCKILITKLNFQMNSKFVFGTELVCVFTVCVGAAPLVAVVIPASNPRTTHTQ